MGERIAGIVILIVMALAGMWAYSTWLHPTTKWSLIAIDQFNEAKVIGIYDTRDECSQKLTEARNKGYDRPECGSNCKAPDTPLGAYVCDDTFEL